VDRLKSDMVSTVSHELKTPLTSVQMAIHLLLEELVGPLNPKQIELLLAARQDSERILTMINDLLDLTRIEHGRVQLELAAVSAAELVEEAVGRFQTQAQSADLVLTADIRSKNLTVLVDRERIEHVFDNLIVNAIQHTGRGGSVRVSAFADGKRVRFVVRDTGEGISAEHVGHIFDKFYRVPTTKPTGGAGLGLAIVREIVAAHGGHIEVTSQPGKGATFTFALPEADQSTEPSSLETAKTWNQRSAS
jgi:signal transduction histidine kinase